LPKTSPGALQPSKTPPHQQTSHALPIFVVMKGLLVMGVKD
jgi:hypothetical protein